VTLALLQRHLLAELSISMKSSLKFGLHAVCLRSERSASAPASIQHLKLWKSNPELFTKGAKNRGADSTRSHERHREAPLRETRQAAPDGRVLRRLSRPVKVRGFLVGLSRCDAKTMVTLFCHTLLQLHYRDISSKFQLRLQPSRAGRQTFRRPATIPRDENLEAKTRRRRKAQGGTEATTRSILELSAAALSFPKVFIAVLATSRMARQADGNPLKFSGRRNVL
jgi:hypothetical protein